MIGFIIIQGEFIFGPAKEDYMIGCFGEGFISYSLGLGKVGSWIIGPCIGIMGDKGLPRSITCGPRMPPGVEGWFVFGSIWDDWAVTMEWC